MPSCSVCQSIGLSVCLFVCLSHSWILLKRINISWIFLTILSFHSKRHGNTATGISLMLVSNAGGVGKNLNLDSWWISGWQTDNTTTVQFIAQTATHQWLLFITACSMYDHNKEKRTEQNSIVCSDKSEAEATNIRRLNSTYCTVKALTTERHEASRGLSATAGPVETRSVAGPVC